MSLRKLQPNEPKYLQSFGRTKSRRIRDNAKRILDEGLPKYTFTELPKNKEVWLEIGFGGGEHLLHQAKNNRDVFIIGCEPFINGTIKLLRGLEDDKLDNVRIFKGDFRILAEQLPNDLFSKVFVLFPDPWPKKKQNKRRIISHETLDLLIKLAKNKADMRIATDHVDYAKWIAAHITSHKGITWQASCKADWQTQPTDHIETKYQKKALNEGRNPVFFNLQINK